MLRAVMVVLCSALCVALLGACAAPGAVRAAPPTLGVHEATAGEVANCTALPTVIGTNTQPVMENGMLAAQSFGSARAAVFVKAQAEGATHLVWGDEIVSAAGSFVTARPYRCDRLAAK